MTLEGTTRTRTVRSDSARSNPSRGAAEFWNSRANAFAGQSRLKSDYPDQFIRLIQPDPEWRVLDIGCGPGTVAIPLATKVRSITALDFSHEMLRILSEKASQANVTNIQPTLAEWNSDWSAKGVSPAELVIASRSLIGDDLEQSIWKLNRFATKKVAVSTFVGQGPFDVRILEAAQRPIHQGRDYIHVVNMLYQMGIYARVDFTYHPINRFYANHDDALEECRWMVPDMTPAEEKRVKSFLRKNLVYQNNFWLLEGALPVRWAVIQWDVSLPHNVEAL